MGTARRQRCGGGTSTDGACAATTEVCRPTTSAARIGQARQHLCHSGSCKPCPPAGWRGACGTARSASSLARPAAAAAQTASAPSGPATGRVERTGGAHGQGGSSPSHCEYEAPPLGSASCNSYGSSANGEWRAHAWCLLPTCLASSDRMVAGSCCGSPTSTTLQRKKAVNVEGRMVCRVAVSHKQGGRAPVQHSSKLSCGGCSLATTGAQAARSPLGSKHQRLQRRHL